MFSRIIASCSPKNLILASHNHYKILTTLRQYSATIDLIRLIWYIIFKYMNQVIHDIGREALRQLFGLQKPRSGKLVLAAHAVQKMTEHKLDRETVENAFRHGKRGRAGMIIHKYARYSIGLYYKRLQTSLTSPLQPEATYLITTCWKGR
jgi:hypothetical protein